MKQDLNGSSQNQFRSWQDELRYWPYTIHQIDDTLDAALIEGRAKQLLFQALNSRLLTAFVGTGISAAYGRMSWTEWKDEQLRTIKELSKAFIDLAVLAQEHLVELIRVDPALAEAIEPEEDKQDLEQDVRLTIGWLRHRERVLKNAIWDVRTLVSTFEAAYSDEGSFPGGESLPILFDIAKKLHNLLLYHRNIFALDDGEQRWEVPPSDEVPEKHILAEDWARIDQQFTQLFDDVGLSQEEFDNKTKVLQFVFGLAVRSEDGAPLKCLPGFLVVASHHGAFVPGRMKRLFKALNNYQRNIEHPFASQTFDTVAKNLLVDECPHASQLLRSALEFGEKVGRVTHKTAIEQNPQLRGYERFLRDNDKSGAKDGDGTNNLKRDLDGIRQNSERYRVLTPFKIEPFVKTIEKVLERGESGASPLPALWRPVIRDFLLVDLEEYVASSSTAALDVERVFLTPTSRYLLPMFSKLLENPFELPILQALPVAPKAEDFRSRRSIVADRFDPLAKVSDRLGVRNFLTTNYDFEIERFFQDKGYRRFDPHRALPHDEVASDDPLQFRTDGLGGTLQDMTFKSRFATDLLAFAAGGSGADASVFHLHGRATQDDNIVVSERDYMELYLRRDLDRDVADESILMAFAATPILFLGLGMSEADVLRPLRQFMSDQDRAIGYRGIVLLPATEGYESRAKTAAGLYLRYGAHTIHYGSGEVSVGPKGKKQPIDWLHRISALIASLRNATTNRLDKLNKINRAHPGPSWSRVDRDLKKPIIELSKLADDVGKIGKDLVDGDGLFEQHPALEVLLDYQDEPQVIKACKNISSILSNSKLDAAKREQKIRSQWELIGEHLDKLSLKNCEFTTYRHQNVETSRNHRVISIEGADYTKFYVRQLSGLMRICLSNQRYRDLAEAKRSLCALVTALDGIKGAIITASLNASLDAIEREWQSWWKDWQTSPPKREARFEQLDTGDLPKEDSEEEVRRASLVFPKREIRHKVESLITDLRHCSNLTASAPEINDLYETAMPEDLQTGVRVFDRFVYDVAQIANVRGVAQGRLVTSVAADRGQGKGVFFSTFATRLGLTSYLNAAHENLARPASDKSLPVFLSAVFVNLSFASEMASVYDMLVSSLSTTIVQARILCGEKRPSKNGLWKKGDFNQSKRNVEEFLNCKTVSSLRQPLRGKMLAGSRALKDEMLDLPRGKQIEFLFNEFQRLSEDMAKKGADNAFERPVALRMLLCVNGAELLFDQRKRPKNFEIADFLGLFASKELVDLPLDCIFIGAPEHLGFLGRGKNRLTRVTYAWPGLSHAKREKLAQRAKNLKLPYEVSDPSKPLDDKAKKEVSRTNFFHLARYTNAQQFMTDNFPVLTMALLLARFTRSDDIVWVPGLSDLEFDRRNERFDALASAVTQAFNTQAIARTEDWSDETPPDATNVHLKTRKTLKTDIKAAFLNCIKGTELYKKLDISDHSVSQRWEPAFSKVLRDEFSNLMTEQDRQDWRDLDLVLAGNRFCLTILLAAAEHLVFSARHFHTGGQLANEMLESTVSQLRNASTGLREELVLTRVMRVYAGQSKLGDIERDHELHKLLLRNIAVLGCPVSSDILVRLPDIREYFNKTTFDQQLSRRRLTARALATIAERGLVFRISPHPKLVRLHAELPSGKLNDEQKELYKRFEQWPAIHEYRYALHRQVQSYCFQRLGHLTAPPVSANSFAPTLYASMPSRVVRLSTEGYLFLRRLLLGLSQYPDIRHEDTARAMPIFRADDVVTKVQALRAGLSLARTCLSIAAVSRFDDSTTGLEFTRKRGHFETYRVRLRWIIRKAWEVHEPRQNTVPSSSDENRVNALYLDEIVWLYNEIAVTSLVQGALVEAIGHVRQAIYLNRINEGNGENGRTHAMLSLNLAIIQLERGRLRAAEKRLQTIVANEPNSRFRVSLIAKGYLALIAQLRGRGDEARQSFLDVVKGLQSEQEDRASAIMLHHLARLVARDQKDEAERFMRLARDYAERGGHEDIRYKITVAEVWMRQELEELSVEQMENQRIKLRDAERYAEVMGIHSLLVDSLHAQGRMLLSAGDHSSSGRLLTKAMAIARRNNMTLRLITIMTNYAKVLLARRRIESAKRLLDAALAMAKRSGHAIQVVRIHDVIDEAERLSSAPGDS